MARAEVIDDLAAAGALAPAWDELARGASLPLCSPGWMLPWWRRLAPAGSEMRVVAVRDGGELLGLAPWFVHQGQRSRVDLRFLGAELSDRVDLLARAGREDEVAQALRGAILGMRPRPDLIAFEAVPAGSSWTRRLAGTAGGGPRLARYRNSVLPAPAVRLPHDSAAPDAWLAGRSSNFRGQMRRMRRRLAARGGRVRLLCEPPERKAGLEAMLALHLERWRGRGASGLARAGVPAMLHEAAAALGPERMRLWTAEIEGEPISVQLFLAAGEELKYWNGGWSERHADLKPSMLTILAALEDAITRGERRLDLGVGRHEYKLRFADSEDELTWGGLVVRNRRWPATRAELAPLVMRHRGKELVRSLPAPVSGRLETLARRGRGER